jgi:excisionase family DNA binding protein
MRQLNEFISVQAAAAALGVSARHVRRLARKGRLRGAQKPGRDWLIPSPVIVLPVSRGRPSIAERNS